MTDSDARHGEQTERYGYSPLTDTWYRLHDWEDLGDGQVRAKGKTEVPRDEVPEEWLDATEERTASGNCLLYRIGGQHGE